MFLDNEDIIDISRMVNEENKDIETMLKRYPDADVSLFWENKKGLISIFCSCLSYTTTEICLDKTNHIKDPFYEITFATVKSYDLIVKKSARDPIIKKEIAKKDYDKILDFIQLELKKIYKITQESQK